MEQTELSQEELIIRKEEIIVKYAALIFPLVLISMSFLGLDNIECTSSLDYYRDTCPSSYGIIFGFISIPFACITAIGASKDDVFLLMFGSFFLLCFCVLIIFKLLTTKVILLMLPFIWILFVLNISILVRKKRIK